MSDESSKSLDILGIKPVADSIKAVTEASLRGVGAFLGRICLPAAEEIGMALKDKVSQWRARNAVQIITQAEPLVDNGLQAHPRLVNAVIQNGSWVDDEQLQKMWAGLLVSSCDEKGDDESNLIFIDMLSRLTSSQVRILDFACRNAKKAVSKAGWVRSGESVFVELQKLIEISGIDDFHRLDRELDHLRSLELIAHGFSPESTTADIMPTPLGLHMFVRCQGFRGSPLEYFQLKVEDKKIEVPQICNMSSTEIVKSMEDLPFLQKQRKTEEFKGKKVNWSGTLLSVYLSETDPAMARLSINTPKDSWNSVICSCMINIKNYPQLEGAKKGQPIRVSGIIEKVESSSISLIDADVQFL